MSDRSLGRTLWNLFLAFLNATLILLAVCLWFGWRLADTVQGISTEVTRAVAEATPIRDDLRGLTDEVSALRADLSSLRDSSDGFSSFTFARYEQKLDDFGGRLSELGQRMESALSDPDALIETAISATADELTGFVIEMRHCRPERGAPQTSG